MECIWNYKCHSCQNSLLQIWGVSFGPSKIPCLCDDDQYPKKTKHIFHFNLWSLNAKKDTFGNYLSWFHHQTRGSSHVKSIDNLMNKTNSPMTSVQKNSLKDVSTPNMLPSLSSLSPWPTNVNASTIGFRVSKNVVRKKTITQSYLKASQITSPPLKKKIGKR